MSLEGFDLVQKYSGDSWMYPYIPLPSPTNSNPEESLENTMNTMGTLLGSLEI